MGEMGYATGEAGFVKGSETSQKAAETIKKGINKDRVAVLSVLKKAPQGLNRDQIVEGLEDGGKFLPASLVSSRMIELVRSGEAVVLTDPYGRTLTRPGRSGKEQQIYKATGKKAEKVLKLPTRYEEGWNAALRELEVRMREDNGGWFVSPGVNAMFEMMKKLKK